MLNKALLTVLPLLASTSEARKCVTATIPVKAMSRNGVFGNLKIPQTSLDATAFIQNLSQQGRNYSQTVLTGYATVSGTYQISTQWCTPDSGATKAVQILTHGIGFEKSYWDIPYANGIYSYVNVALDAGYSTLSFDRLGTGLSSHPEPLDETQAALEVAVIYELTCMLRSGSFPSAPDYKPEKIVHVGHSFGSGQTYALANMYPDASDGIVLTGFSTNGSFMGYFLAGGNFFQAKERYPDRFANLSAGYLISGNAEADQYNFLRQDRVDPALAEMGEQTKQPVTVGELLTVGSLPMTNMFKGPVMIYTGENDLPFCGGNCLATGDPDLPSIPAASKKAFPNVGANDFLAYIQPETAHGLTFHYNQTAGAQVVQNFLKSHGL